MGPGETTERDSRLFGYSFRGEQEENFPNCEVSPATLSWFEDYWWQEAQILTVG
jgi:hypothetical protein